jgi:regulator of sigma E protease
LVVIFFMLTAIVFIIILGLLIFVHEFGHFVTARRSGIKAEEFGFGFPPRAIGIYWNEEKKRYAFVWGKKHIDTKETIFSLNWIPLGGFVRIKGEDGSMAAEPDSFAAKSAKKRIIVLAAGVIMNFFLAWVLISMAMMIGAPQPVEEGQPISGTALDSKIQVSQVISDSPAQISGLKIGDEIVRCVGNVAICNKRFTDIGEVQKYINDNKGREIIISIRRGNNFTEFKSIPRIDYPENQGPLGISLTSTQIIQYPWYEAIGRGFVATYNLIILIVTTLFGIIKNLFIGQKVAVDVSGPIGIALLTKQVTELGLVYILQFAALLSINLGIINILPFPALDGGRILFILIEKIKGSPVSQKVEQAIHSSGFILLIMLMLFITFRDVVKNNILDKFRNLF